MNKTDIAKKTVSFVIGVGTSKIVHGIVQNNTNPEKLPEKVAIIGASYVMGAIAGDITKKYTDAKIDELVSWWRSTIKAKI